MNSIEDLNQRWWYRLIKVIILITVATSIFVNIVYIYEDYGINYSGEKSYIQCENGKIFYLEENGFYASSGGLSSYGEDRAAQHCLHITTDGSLDLSDQQNANFELIFGLRQSQLVNDNIDKFTSHCRAFNCC